MPRKKKKLDVRKMYFKPEASLSLYTELQVKKHKTFDILEPCSICKNLYIAKYKAHVYSGNYSNSMYIYGNYARRCDTCKVVRAEKDLQRKIDRLNKQIAALNKRKAKALKTEQDLVDKLMEFAKDNGLIK